MIAFLTYASVARPVGVASATSAAPFLMSVSTEFVATRTDESRVTLPLASLVVVTAT